MNYLLLIAVLNTDIKQNVNIMPPRIVIINSNNTVVEPAISVTNSIPFVYNQPLTNCWIESRINITDRWSNDYDYHFDTNNDGSLSLVPNHPTNHMFYRVGGEVIQ